MLVIPEFSMTGKRELFLFLFYCVYYIRADLQYTGDKFPTVYLETLDVSKENDLELYIDRLIKMHSYLKKHINKTDASATICTYFCKGTLKRTLRDYGHKLQKYRKALNKLIWDGGDIISHYVYRNKYTEPPEERSTGAVPLADDTALVHSIGSFKINVLQKWINKDEVLKVNKYTSGMDDLTLTKEKFANLTVFAHSSKRSGINGRVSDHCLDTLFHDMDPHELDTLRPCKYSSICRDGVFKSPSAAYSLNHRMLLQFMYLTNRRCYLRSPELDLEHLHELCAAMYRETVYLARRGYFFRDLFVEHIGFCSMMGYEEFHRRRWFRKAASWIKKDGCIEEDLNFRLNRSKIVLTTARNEDETNQLLEILREREITKCYDHLLSVALVAMSNAIRHAAHYL